MEPTPIFRYKELASTNDTAKKFALADAPYGTIIMAGKQTAGRGRLGRTFTSPEGGLYMSIIVPPYMEMPTIRASVVVASILRGKFDVDADVKWVNDVLVGDKKICGILAEGVFLPETNMPKAIVLGIGLNIKTPEGGFPEELNAVALDELSDISDLDTDRLATDILDGIFSDNDGLIESYKELSCVSGRNILVYKNGLDGEALSAVATDITANGGLTVRYDNGEEETLISGEISIRTEA